MSAAGRRKRNGSVEYHEEWDKFVELVRQNIQAARSLPDELKRSPYYSHSNVVKRCVYEFFEHAKKRIKPGPLELVISDIRAASIGDDRARTLKKSMTKEPYYWLLTGLSLDCPEANLCKSEVTRFAQHLNYARRHRVPPEYLIGFLMQTGSNAEVYRRALDLDRREPWFVEKTNS